MVAPTIELDKAWCAMPNDESMLNKADNAILEDLHREQPDYIPLVANRLGMHLTYVETRCEELVDDGLLTQVTGEAVYCLTADGEQYLSDAKDRKHETK